MPFKRARHDDEKHARRLSILNAAQTLFDIEAGQLPTVSQISKQANIAKGTLYLYFRSKEEVFLGLLEKIYMEWFATLELALSLPDSNRNNIIEHICSFVELRPEFLQLTAISRSMIEPNTCDEVLTAHKTRLHKALLKSAYALAGVIPELSEREAANLMVRSYAMLQGLWLMCYPATNSVQILEKHNLFTLRPDFGEQARKALSALWQEPLPGTKPSALKNTLFAH